MVVMSTKATALMFIFMIFTLNAMPPIYACGHCTPPHPPYHRPDHPKTPKPPKVSPAPPLPPVIVTPPMPPMPPVIVTPPAPIIVTPPPLSPPAVIYPPPIVPAPPYWGVPPVVPPKVRCPIDALKLGLCLDVLQGLVHVGIGNPIENICCPVIQGLLELEAAICLCTVIRLKLLNLNIFVPLALQVLATCGLTPPPGFVCPPL